MVELVALAAFEAQMRIGSIEMGIALLAVAVAAGGPRVRVAPEAGRLVPMRVDLEIFEAGQSRSYQGRPPFEVGRAGGSDVVLHDPEVSRTHARFDSRNGIV